MSDIRFRPHHFLCTVGFEGKGYSEEFVANYRSIADALRNAPNGDETLIEVVGDTDSICAPCPNRRGNLCETEEKIRKLDSAHAKILGLKPGDRLTWREAKARIREKMTIEVFRSACEPCSWQESGICERALRKLLKDRELGSLVVAFLFGSILALAPVTAKADEISEIAARQTALRAKVVGKTKASKSAKALARASESLDGRKYPAALVSAAAAEKDAEFADHALAIRGFAELAQAEDLLPEEPSSEKKTDWEKIGSHANRSLEAWTKIHQAYAYSPWWPGAPKEIAKAELDSALALMKRKKNIPALALFEKAYQRLSLENALSLVKSRHLSAYADLCKKKNTELCLAWIIRFAHFYSKNSAESKLLGTKYPDVVEAAKPTFANSKITTGYKQKDADEEAFDQAFPLIVESSWNEAVDAFKKFLEDYPRSAHRFRARYWLAFALEKKTRSYEESKPHYEQLIRETPLTVYGLLSMFALGQDPSGRFKGDGPSFVDHDDLQTPIEAARLSRAKKLLAAKADRLAAMDLRSLRSRDTASGPYLIWLSSFASSAGAHIASFSILSDLIARMDESVYTQDGLDLVFPVVEWPLVEKLATAAGLDPILVLSLIKQESAFDREAGSSVGATGFMQLMPFTASDIESDVERRDLLEVETNVRIGTKYLRKVLDRFKGNVALALAGYNAGPTAVDRWVKEGRAERSFLEFVEQIPYKETRDYVGTIYRNYIWYQFRLKGTRISTTDPFWPGSVPRESNSK